MNAAVVQDRSALPPLKDPKLFRDRAPRFIGHTIVEHGTQTYDGDFRNAFAQWVRRLRQCR